MHMSIRLRAEDPLYVQGTSVIPCAVSTTAAVVMPLAAKRLNKSLGRPYPCKTPSKDSIYVTGMGCHPLQQSNVAVLRVM